MSTINHIDPAYFIANSMMYSIAFPFADTNQLFVPILLTQIASLTRMCHTGIIEQT